MSQILTLDSMKNISIDEIIRLYQLGYKIGNLAVPIVDPVVNFGKVTVSTGYTSLATSIVLNTGNGAKLPDPSVNGAFNLVWWNSTDYSDPSDDPYVEIVRCTVRSIDTLTVVRAQESVLASNKNIVGKTYKMILSPTAKMISDIKTDAQSRVDTHSVLSTGVHGVGAGYPAIASGYQYTAVNKAGDTMTGTLNLPSNGLIVGTNQLIVSGGNVGIGTTNPVYGNLQIEAPAVALYMKSNGVNSYSLFSMGASNGARVGYFGVEGSGAGRTDVVSTLDNATYFGSRTSDATQIISANTVRMTILNSGNVGIGTTTPDRQLTVSGGFIGIYGSDITGFGLIFKNTNSLNKNWDLSPSGNDLHLNETGISAIMTFKAGGNVGIGTITPTYQLQLSLDSAAKPGTNTWTISSDERIKKDIRPFSEGLETVLNINPVWYKYNGKAGFKEDDKDHIGVIGQHIQNIAPYTINTYKAKLNEEDEEETELLNFNSHALTFVLINAMKEMKKEIDSLKEEIKILKNN